MVVFYFVRERAIGIKIIFLAVFAVWLAWAEKLLPSFLVSIRRNTDIRL
jgi:hypothetical protein